MATTKSSSPSHSPQQGTSSPQIISSTPCDQALSTWFEQHKAYIRGGTVRTYRQYIKTLSTFFGAKPLAQIGISEVRAYQQWRNQTCVATRVNAELSSLQMCMKEADLWATVAKLYRPLPVAKTKVRQNMSEEEERRLLAVAFTHPRRRVAGHCLIVMANTSMGFGELRHIRRQDVFLSDDPPFVEVNAGAKNDYRLRSIPLNFFALRSMRWIVKRWEELGGSDPGQYILPHHARRTADERARPGHKPSSPPIFSEPMGHIYRAARGILKDAGLDHLDPYDMRSHFITRVLSDPDVSDQMYTEIVGHVGNAMKRRYSKQRMENKRKAVDAMCKTQVDLCERQADSEAKTRNRQIESEVRASLGLPEASAPAKRHEPLPAAVSRQPSQARLGTARRRTIRVRPKTDRQRQTYVDLTDPTIQAEIARQVALALQREREEQYVPAAHPAVPPTEPKGRVLAFPGRSTARA
jgi:integrase